MAKEKIKVAFIKFGGMASGGTEKFLQTIAANLPKERFDIDFFYCDAAPYIGSDWKHPDTKQERIQYMLDHGITPIKFHVDFKNVTIPTHDWVGTDLFDVFDETNYDIIQSGRSGHPEFPFTKITKTPIVDSLHLVGMVDKQPNIAKVAHVSKWAADVWIQNGGQADKVEVVGLPIEIDKVALKEIDKNFKKDLGLKDKFVFGMHQRDDDGIFSNIPLDAYKKIETDDTAFVMLGGSDLYQKQATELGIKSFTKLDFSANLSRLYSFLTMLDAYAHGRKDGENNSQSMAESMYFGMPIVSHVSQHNNGHVDIIAGAGVVARSMDEYIEALRLIRDDPEKRKEFSNAAKEKFIEYYDLKTQIGHFVRMYEEVYGRKKKEQLSDDDYWDQMFD